MPTQNDNENTITLMRKIVVITGAGVGIGRAVATEFVRNGCDVALLSHGPERLQRAAGELAAFGRRALPIPADVTDAKAIDIAAERVERQLGPIDSVLSWLGYVAGSLSAVREHVRTLRRIVLAIGATVGRPMGFDLLARMRLKSVNDNSQSRNHYAIAI
jgi:NAD(P)-dependent dehydrogenase (short-subunit alcohol dehydrogenase family)